MCVSREAQQQTLPTASRGAWFKPTELTLSNRNVPSTEIVPYMHSEAFLRANQMSTKPECRSKSHIAYDIIIIIQSRCLAVLGIHLLHSFLQLNVASHQILNRLSVLLLHNIDFFILASLGRLKFLGELHTLLL